MIQPVQITFRNMEPTEAVAARIQEEAAKLDTFFDRIMSCHVIVEAPHRHRQRGRSFQIRVRLTVPDDELLVNHEPTLRAELQDKAVARARKASETEGPHKDIYVAIRDAFQAARRQLQDYVRRRTGAVKKHEGTPRAHVSRLSPVDGFGFLETADGREIYFHRNSVLNDAFDQLQIGSEVIFSEEQGEKGQQASTVRFVGRRHAA